MHFQLVQSCSMYLNQCLLSYTYFTFLINFYSNMCCCRYRILTPSIPPSYLNSQLLCILSADWSPDCETQSHYPVTRTKPELPFKNIYRIMYKEATNTEITSSQISRIHILNSFNLSCATSRVFRISDTGTDHVCCFVLLKFIWVINWKHRWWGKSHFSPATGNSACCFSAK